MSATLEENALLHTFHFPLGGLDLIVDMHRLDKMTNWFSPSLRAQMDPLHKVL